MIINPSLTRTSVFTLIELLVVMAIRAMLAGLVGPKVMNVLGESKSKTARIQLEALSAALDIYRLDTGSYPRRHHGLRALVERGDGVESWNGPKTPGVSTISTTSPVNMVITIFTPSARTVLKAVRVKRRISTAGSE
jgi:prepilin-type N-terminal cleavage/methylation domain-containing protein